MAKGKKKSSKVKIRHIGENRLRRIQTEINKCVKKLKKLLQLHESGKKCWSLNKKGERVESNKTQGIIPESKRHKALRTYINMLKSKLK
jgi:hypothetical protein